jgi:two-component system, NtrC family, sensor kinase
VEVVETMADRRLSMLDDLRQAERRVVSSRVASVVAHLIGTPLHVIAGRASLIRAAPTDPGVAENARRIEEQVERLARRIRALIDYLMLPEPDTAPELAENVIVAALSVYTPVAEERGCEIRRVGEPLVDVKVDGTSGLIVLTSLFSLATRIAPKGKPSELVASITEDQRVLLELTIPGLEPPSARLDTLEPPEHIDPARVEELQVLSVCSAIARRCQGSIQVTAAPQPGHATIRYLMMRLT